MQPLLSIKNLSVNFVKENYTTHAVENISFDVYKKEVIAVVGESGSGKSVTALSILRLLQKNITHIKNGEILFNEIDLLKCDEDVLQNIRGNEIAMIFQEPMTSLNPVITCGEQVSEVLRLHKKLSYKIAKQRTMALFEEVELPNPSEIFNRYPHEISGGQKQRVMIAMAMSCSPRILICDEPTTALDVLVQQNILLLLKKLQQQNNMSVIFISHDFAVVKNIADKIVVLYKGKIVEENTGKNIFENPQHNYTKALLSCRPALHEKGERLPSVSEMIEAKSEVSNQKSAIRNQKSENQSLKSEIQPSTILSVQNVCVYFPLKKNFFGKPLAFNKAVDDVSFDIQSGETVGLVGGSGCGKTTLGRTVLGLIKPTSGKIIFKEKDISTFTKDEWKTFRKDVQIIFQDPYSSLNPTKKIGDAIAEPMLVHKIFSSEKECFVKVISLLDKVNLSSSFYNRFPHELSGGQRQRVVIARALALNPSLLICDECISALDVSVQAQVLNLLNDLKKEFSLTIFFISHDLSAVHYLCDKIIVMNKGKIEESGNADAVWLSPKSDYAKRLLKAVTI